MVLVENSRIVSLARHVPVGHNLDLPRASTKEVLPLNRGKRVHDSTIHDASGCRYQTGVEASQSAKVAHIARANSGIGA